MKTKRVFYSLIFFFLLFSCSYPLVKENELHTDNNFISFTLQNHDLTKARTRDKLIQEYSQNPSAERQIDLGVLYCKNSDISRAETTMRESINGKYSVQGFLNLSRLFYILDEYSVIRESFRSSLNSKNKSWIQQVLLELDKANRYEEKIILMGELQNIPGFETMAYLELGIYFHNKRNYPEAEYYFEKILMANPFHTEALYYMAASSLENGRWEDVLLYSKNIANRRIADKYEDIHYLAAKAHYELHNYKACLATIEKSPGSLKEQTYFLELWRDTLFSLNKPEQVSVIRPYLRKIQQKGVVINENEFLLYQSSGGKLLYNEIFYGK